MSNETLLEVKNLAISVEQRSKQKLDLVKDISFQIQRGEIVGLVGESGSGKSLTSLSILGLLPEKVSITEGSIHFGESQKNLVTTAEKEMRKIRGKQISMIFQEPMSSLNPMMRCGVQVDEMLLNHSSSSKSEAKVHTIDLFQKVQLPDPERAYSSYPHELSGGQLQRIMIAMALACDPQLLIADECTTALDVTVQKEIVALLKGINETENISILFISHDLDVIAEIADKVIVMKNGKILEQGNIKQIFNQANHPYTKQLIASKPPLNIKLKQLPRPQYFTEQGASARDFYQKNEFTREEILDRRAILETAEPILEVRDLVKFYTKEKNFWGKPTAYVKAVDKISLTVRKGETLGLVGESGCGKSTLSKAILKLIPADSGEVIFNGSSLFDLSPRELRRKRSEIQYIFQDPYSSLNPRLTIGYAIQEPMAVHSILPTKKARKEKVMELLDLVGLEETHYSRYPHEFSGGQRQRICIARALSLNPSFLVCDEIVSALDVSVQAQVLNLLIELRDRLDLSMLFVSHDLAIVKFISDRLIVMNHGNIVEQGWSEEVYKNPQQDYTKRLLNAIPGATKIHAI